MNKRTEKTIRTLLTKLGENPEREGLIDTPKRYFKALKEFLNPPDFKFTVFDSEEYDEMIIEAPIPFHSICEHHLLPFMGVAAVAYIPDKKIVGLSKLARVVETYSRRFQNQERITTQIADLLEEQLKPKGVAVTLKARHMCMEMRGVRKPGVFTTTSCLRGAFKEDKAARDEFLKLSLENLRI